MREGVTALLVFHHVEPYNHVENALDKLAVTMVRARTLAEARRIMSWRNPPLLVFTESVLPDGNWADVVSFSRKTPSPVSVVVVGREFGTKLHASAIEMGAFDFIAPPFDDMDLAHVIRCAGDNALRRRQAAKNDLAVVRQSFPITHRNRKSA